MTLDEMKNIKKPIVGSTDKSPNWIIGINGDDKILKTKDFEVGVFIIKKGESGDFHYHKVSTEINYIIRGKCTVSIDGISHKLKDGDYFIYPPGVPTNVKYSTDTILLCIKVPSVEGNDKYYKDNIDDEG